MLLWDFLFFASQIFVLEEARISPTDHSSQKPHWNTSFCQTDLFPFALGYYLIRYGVLAKYESVCIVSHPLIIFFCTIRDEMDSVL